LDDTHEIGMVITSQNKASTAGQSKAKLSKTRAQENKAEREFQFQTQLPERPNCDKFHLGASVQLTATQKTRLSKPKLSKPKLSKAKRSNVRLRKAKVSLTKLSNSKLRKATASTAKLSKANQS
jgi:uncharacterized protein YjbI with pentapeptide repeats